MPTAPKPWIIDYLDPSGFIDPTRPLDPGFTQILNDTVGELGGPADGFDQVVSALSGIVDSLGPVLDQQDAALDGVLTALAAADTTPADNSFNGFLGTFDAGNAIVATAGGLGVPDLGELPISTSFEQGIVAPPAQLTHDFGTVQFNSGTQMFKLGSENISTRRVTGMTDAQQISGDTAVLNQVDVDLTSGPDNTGDIVHYMAMNPVKVGTFTAQVNTVGGTASGIAIWTFTVTVTP